jgi:hypothetical protein
MKKVKKHSRTGTERSSSVDQVIERMGGPGGAAYRSSRAKRPDILKLKNKKKPLPTKTEAARMIKANKKTTTKKKKNVAGRAGIVARKAFKVAAPLSVSAGAGAAVNQWINQGPEKKK